MAKSKSAKIRVARTGGCVEIYLRDGVSLDEQILLTDAEAEKLARKLAKAGFRAEARKTLDTRQDAPILEGQPKEQADEFSRKWRDLYRQGCVGWHTGMRTVHGGRVVELTERLALVAYTSPEPTLLWENPAHTCPDPNDWVTKMVIREIWLGAMGFRWKPGAGSLSRCNRSELDLTRNWRGTEALDYLNAVEEHYRYLQQGRAD